MSIIKEKIKLLQIIPRRNIPSVLLKTIRRMLIKKSPKVGVTGMDAGKMDMVFSSPAAQVIADLFDCSKPFEKVDEIPIFGNPGMRLKLSDLMQNGWTDIQISDCIDSAALKDRRFVWEISRLQFLPLMTRSMTFSKEKLLGVITAWRSANRFPLGINWESPLEVAVRLMNVLAAGAILNKQGILGDEIKHELSKLFFESFAYLEDNLEYGDGLPSNHLIVEACVLFITSKALSLNEKADTAFRIIENTLKDQISAGGLLLESSLPYTAFVLEAYLLFVLVCGMDKETEVDHKILDRVGEMYYSMVSLVGENLIVPSIGDDDSTRILRFESISTDEPLRRSYLTTIYNKTFSKRSKVAEEGDEPAGKASTVLWLDREAGFGSLSKGLCRVVFRFPGSREFRLGSHCHSDYLSFCLYFNDIEVFGDPGSFLYSDHISRAVFRSEESHSTLFSGSRPQREFLKSPFISLVNRKMECDLSSTEDSFSVGLFFRYGRGVPVSIKRLFTIPDDHHMRIVDTMLLDIINLNMKWSFILSPYLRIDGIDEANQRVKSVRITGEKLKIRFELPSLFDIRVDEIRYSRYYGQTEPTQRISLIPKYDLVHSDVGIDQHPLFFEVCLET